LRRLFDDERDRLLSGLGFERALALGFEQTAQPEPHRRLIVNYQNFVFTVHA